MSAVQKLGRSFKMLINRNLTSLNASWSTRTMLRKLFKSSDEGGMWGEFIFWRELNWREILGRGDINLHRRALFCVMSRWSNYSETVLSGRKQKPFSHTECISFVSFTVHKPSPSEWSDDVERFFSLSHPVSAPWWRDCNNTNTEKQHNTTSIKSKMYLFS